MPRPNPQLLRDYYIAHDGAHDIRSFPGGRLSAEAQAFLAEVSAGLGDTAIGGAPLEELRNAGEDTSPPNQE